jgi:hypothetical protein
VRLAPTARTALTRPPPEHRYCLEKRSEMSEPYTLLGSVLVAVNPLMVIPDPPGIKGNRKAISYAHPYGIAEVAYGASSPARCFSHSPQR